MCLLRAPQQSRDVMSGEYLVGGVDLETFTNARTRSIVTADPQLVRLRFFTPDGKTLLADIGCTPAAARQYAKLLVLGADRIDPLKSEATDG